MWFKKKKISTTVRDMQRLNEMNEYYNSKIKELNEFKSLLCPYSHYGHSNELLAEAITEKVYRLEKEKLEL
ncbi:MAG: hypothetical protein GY931_11520 [Maribacter sp.]|nr:hypothetical protein [Maribacter sp.]